MTLQEQLCEKMRVEQSAYCLWLTAQPPEEILHHAYEYSVREDIILATEEMNLTLAQVRALLKSPAPLADVYKDFSKLETDYMSIVAQCVEDRADTVKLPLRCWVYMYRQMRILPRSWFTPRPTAAP